MNADGATGRRSHGSQMPRVLAVVAFCVALLVGGGVWDGVTPPSDSDARSAADRIEVFTLVSTGIVFVDPETSDIVWKSAAGDTTIIGKEPWRNPGTARPSEATGTSAWRENRDIVGNPDHNVVAWVETNEGTREDLVVVEASTGDVLARAPIWASTERSVVIASVDDDTVAFATPDPRTGLPYMSGADIWIWRWAAGESPRPVQNNLHYNDVSAGTWALYETDAVEFVHEGGPTLVTTPDPGDWMTDFGSALSPDGKYWYRGMGGEILDTSTGIAVLLPSARKLTYGWTGAAELTLTRPYLVCSAVTGQCRGPAGISGDVCAPYGVVCGNHLPVN